MKNTPGGKESKFIRKTVPVIRLLAPISLKNGKQNNVGSDHALWGRNHDDSFLVSRVSSPVILAESSSEQNFLVYYSSQCI